MSHDRGCPCGKESYEYSDCTRQDCMRRKTRDLSVNRARKVRGGAPSTDGNCVQCSVATLLGLYLRDVPDFVGRYEGLWLDNLAAWLETLGYEIVMFEGYKPRKGLWLLDGRSPRRPMWNHMIVMSGDKMYHDPHESDKGLITIRRSYWVMPLDPSTVKT